MSKVTGGTTNQAEEDCCFIATRTEGVAEDFTASKWPIMKIVVRKILGSVAHIRSWRNKEWFGRYDNLTFGG